MECAGFLRLLIGSLCNCVCKPLLGRYSETCVILKWVSSVGFVSSVFWRVHAMLLWGLRTLEITVVEISHFPASLFPGLCGVEALWPCQLEA